MVRKGNNPKTENFYYITQTKSSSRQSDSNQKTHLFTKENVLFIPEDISKDKCDIIILT